MEKYAGGVAKYRAAEGKEVLVPYRGPVDDTVQEILGGVRSACTYVGARRLREFSKRTTFVRVRSRRTRCSARTRRPGEGRVAPRIIALYVPRVGPAAPPHAAWAQCALGVSRRQTHRRPRGGSSRPADRAHLRNLLALRRVERELTPAEHATLVRLLTYGPHDEAARGRRILLLVVPRPGTISPWSSKATYIARNCGLAPVKRVERGVGYWIATRGGSPLRDAERAALFLSFTIG